MSTFSAIDYIKNANEREQATREGKPIEPKPVAAVEPKPADAKPEDAKPADDRTDDEHEHAGRVSRSTRRLLRQLGEAEGRAKVLEELVKAGKGESAKAAVVEEDSEPKIADFKTYEDYTKALSTWAARGETKKAVNENEQLEAMREQFRAMDAKAAEDKKLLPDFDQVAQEAIEDGPEFVPDEHPTLMGLLATSDMKAFVLYHLAKHPAEFEKMLALSKTPGEQIRAFARLEGRCEKLYGKEPTEKSDEKAEKKIEEKKEPTVVERDAKKARPSEAVAARGGSAPANQVSPVLGDGRTLNPAWKERANEREGRRR